MGYCQKVNGAHMELLSTRYFEEYDRIGELNFDSVFCEAKRAERFVIISAYYSVGFLKEALSSVNLTKRKDCQVRMVFNGFGGIRLAEQVKELCELKAWARENRFRDIKIYLQRDVQIFHTKLYYFENDEGSVWFSGSANASFSAFEKNEELLFKSTEQLLAIRQYVDSFDWCTDEDCQYKDEHECNEVSHIEPEKACSTDLIGLFRTGVIFFKPKRQLNFTFKGIELPPEVQEKLSNAETRPRYTNPGKAWGAYNIKIGLGLNTSDEDEGAGKIHISTYSVETCLGYWVPNYYVEKVRSAVVVSSAKKKREFDAIRDAVNEIGVDTLVSQYEEYLLDVAQILDTNKIYYPLGIQGLTRDFRKFADNLINQLNNDKKLARLCNTLIDSRMPEIWEDEGAANDFVETFFDDVQANLLKTKPSRVAKALSQRMGLSADMTDEDLEEAVENYFAEYRWNQDCWNLENE